MTREYSVAEARNHLSRVIRDAEIEGPVRITRRGKSAAVLMSEKEYRKLKTARSGFWAALEAFNREADAEHAGLERSDFQGLRSPDPGREVDL